MPQSESEGCTCYLQTRDGMDSRSAGAWSRTTPSHISNPAVEIRAPCMAAIHASADPLPTHRDRSLADPHCGLCGCWKTLSETPLSGPALQGVVCRSGHIWKPCTALLSNMYAVYLGLSTLPRTTTTTAIYIYPFTVFVEAFFALPNSIPNTRFAPVRNITRQPQKFTVQQVPVSP
jgi:hypothetical protein